MLQPSQSQHWDNGVPTSWGPAVGTWITCNQVIHGSTGEEGHATALAGWRIYLFSYLLNAMTSQVQRKKKTENRELYPRYAHLFTPARL